MAKKRGTGKKLGGAAGIATIEDDLDERAELAEVKNGSHLESEPSVRAKRSAKPKAEPTSNGHVAVSDIRKAATFANSVGGLDKAIAILQILKVAKEVQ